MNGIIILGIDPGLKITGYGVIEVSSAGERLIEGGIIRTKARETTTLPHRLLDIYNETLRILQQFSPDNLVVEELYAHYNHPRTAIVMGHARGTILLAAGMCSVTVVEYSATRIKKSLTGNGRASKEQVRRMVVARLKLESEPEPPDVSDSLAAALCHASHCRSTVF